MSSLTKKITSDWLGMLLTNAPKYLIIFLACEAAIILTQIVLFQLIKGDPLVNRYLLAEIARIEHSIAASSNTSIPTAPSVKATTSIEVRLAALEKHQALVDSKFHKSLKP